MAMDVHPGFTIYRNSEGPIFATLHSGPAVETPTSRDDNSDTVASVCWMKMGGSLVFSNLTRKRSFGIDFNRAAPSITKSVEMYDKFIKDEKKEELRNYRREYAWVAEDKKDHYERLRIYDNFWFQIKNLGNFFIFVHRKFSRLRNYPSAMDVSCFKGMGVKREIIEKIIDDVNKKYQPFFLSVEGEYKESIMLEQRRALKRFGQLGIGRIRKPVTDSEFNLAEDIMLIKKHAEADNVKKLEEDFSDKNFIAASKNALERMEPPKITLERIFVGDLSHAPREKFYLKEMSKDKIVLEVESNQFMNYWYPETAADMINEIVNGIKTAEMYKKMGHKQTEILKFLDKKEQQ